MKLSILGIRGIPARHGGFETFAEKLALYLKTKNWNVTVYCQNNSNGQQSEELWNGIRLVHVPVKRDDAVGTIIFDLKSTWLAAKEGGLILTLGYNTALFTLLYRVRGIKNLINMDGLEWKRQKWSFPQKLWLYLNERVGCFLGNHLIADHPAIARHLASRVPTQKITMIPYGENVIDHADVRMIEDRGLSMGNYVLLIARAEPENSILEVIKAFSSKKRGMPLVVLGNYDPSNKSYHRLVKDAASDEVLFMGAIYDKKEVEALRCYTKLYVHGHQVGGTNPSLIESLAAGNAILAHDNQFNRWVAGEGQRFFKNEEECSRRLDHLLSNDDLLASMKKASLHRYREEFTSEKIMKSYEVLLTEWNEK